jgi:hypothetical protein
MSYSTDPLLDAQRHFDKVHAYEERVQEAELQMSTDFMKLVGAGDVGAAAEFAPRVRDYSKGVASVNSLPKRVQRLHECIEEGISYLNMEQELMQLVINAANGRDVRADAMLLMSQCAAKFAEMNVDVGDDE